MLLTTGVAYRRLAAPGIDRFTGSGVYYGATSTEAQSCGDEDVYIVGGANSAGQAAMYLSRHAKSVTLLVRGPALERTAAGFGPDSHSASRRCTGNRVLRSCLEFRARSCAAARRIG